MVRLLILMALLSFFGCGNGQPASPPAKDAQLTRIHFSATHGYHAHSNIGYKAERTGEGKARVTVEVGDDRDRVFNVEEAVMDSLEAIVREYKMYSYNGYYQPKFEIMDGDSWSLDLSFSDKTNASCGGYMAYPPKGGAEAIGKVEGFLSRWLYQEPAEEVALVSFRYELHDANGSEIYALQKKGSACTAFVQLYGQDKGYTYEGVSEYVPARLGDIVRWNHMASYTGENPAEEDTSRPRWILRVEYENGQKIETMDYFDRPVDEDSWRKGIPSQSEMGLRNETERYFSETIQRMSAADGNK